MGQKVHPTGFRIGVTEDWRSRWFASKENFGDLLVEDQKIRKFIQGRDDFGKMEIAQIDIERTRDEIVIQLHTARPGYLIGKSGKGIEELKTRLEDQFLRRFEIKVLEVQSRNKNAQLVADAVAAQLGRRGSFRRVLKRTLDEVMDGGGVHGIKIEIAGRLGGADMSRVEKVSRGSIPLSTLRRHIDYGFTVAQTAQGSIGVKVWLDLGLYEEMTNGADA